jgi:F0F1-type ATP synthase assembly protein I|tara:strand:+ start:284 stop:559 length:276 start_codon:yes stop_codon:yes gene_type:complete
VTSSSNREVGSGFIGSLQHSSGSYELVVGAVLAGLAGFGIDSIAGTRPVFTATFACLGLAGAATSIIFSYRARMVLAETDRTQRRVQGSAS